MQITQASSTTNPALHLTTPGGLVTDTTFAQFNNRAQVGYDGTNAAAYLQGTAGKALELQTGGANTRLFIASGGNININNGTNTPLATLDLRANSGTLAIASVSGQTSFAALTVDNSGVGDLFTASSSGLPRFVITQNGNVGYWHNIPI